MTGMEFKKVTEFEAALAVGAPVRVNWTNCGSCYSGVGTVHKLNKASVLVTLTEDVPCSYAEPYRTGRTIKVPLFTFSSASLRDWSINNRVEPVAGY